MRLLLGLGIPALMAGCILLGLHSWALVGPGTGLVALGATLTGAAVERADLRLWRERSVRQSVKAGDGSTCIQAGGDLHIG